MNEDKSLEFLKAKMTEKQRKDMADVISNEISRREQLKKGATSHDEMKEVYADMQRKMAAAKAEPKRRYSMPGLSKVASMGGSSPLKNLDIFLLGAAIVLCGAKVVNRGTSEFSKTQPPAATSVAAPAAITPVAFDPANFENLSTEKQLLMELDSRRTELERRKAALDTKEDELKEQARALAERSAELKSLNTRLSQVRKERDAQYESRMDQLSNVYASMAPTEAAPLIAKLETNTALEILRRMPGKRIGQILGAIAPDRAVQLTKELTDRKLSIRD